MKLSRFKIGICFTWNKAHSDKYLISMMLINILNTQLVRALLLYEWSFQSYVITLSYD